jgi:hypothetical protein
LVPLTLPFFHRFGYQPIDDGGELREITFAPTVTAVPMFRDPEPVQPAS